MTDSEMDLCEGLQLYGFNKAAGQQMSKSHLQWWQLDVRAWLQESSREISDLWQNSLFSLYKDIAFGAGTEVIKRIFS